jgi:hypothetical protein
MEEIFLTRSLAEAVRCAQLAVLEREGTLPLVRKIKAGEISNFCRTVRVQVEVNGTQEWVTVYLLETLIGWQVSLQEHKMITISFTQGNGASVPPAVRGFSSFTRTGGFHSRDPHFEAQALNFSTYEIQVLEAWEVPYVDVCFGKSGFEYYVSTMILFRVDEGLFFYHGQQVTEEEARAIVSGALVPVAEHPQGARVVLEARERALQFPSSDITLTVPVRL